METGRSLGRYKIYGEIAVGGMATVHLGRLIGAAGFARTVAIKKLHPQFARDPEFVNMFTDEARLASRINHPNVVSSLDVVAEDGELLLVMEYVHGETLARLLRLCAKDGGPPSPEIVVGMMLGALYGLHAAHIATSEGGRPLGIVHRDVSPQNIIVGVDGIARVLDFGVAKAAMRTHTTSQGQVKGKLAYMSPEQLRGADVDARTDVFAAGVVAWECLTMRRLFQSDDVGQLVGKLLESKISPPSRYNPKVSPQLDAVILRSLSRNVDERFSSAHEFAVALESASTVATRTQVGEWTGAVANKSLSWRQRLLDEIEVSSTHSVPEVSGIIGAPYDDLSASAVSQYRSDPRSAPASRILTATTPLGPAPVSAGKARRSRWWLWGGLAILLMAPVFYVVLLGVSPRQTPSRVERTLPEVASPVAAEVRPPPTAHPAVEPVRDEQNTVSDERQGAPVATEQQTSPLPQTTAPSALEPSRARRVTVVPKRAKPRADCDPPYRVDEKGIRRIKPECL